MSEFRKAIGVILKHEGGLVDDPDDPGGITNFGISYRWARSALGYTRDDIKAMTKSKASEIYREHWWVKNRYGEIDDQQLATKVFDMSVNMGSTQAVRMLQRAVNDLCITLPPAPKDTLVVDGVIGEHTAKNVNLCPASELIDKLIELQSAFYLALASHRPSMEKFLPGWLKRAAWPRSA